MTTHDSLPAPDPGNDAAGQWERLCRFLQAEAFIILTHNAANAAGQEYEAWAYQGPLDFEFASPVRFGLGCDPTAALKALAGQLPDQSLPAATPAPAPAAPAADRMLVRVDRRDLATILAALRFHQDENLQGGGTIPDEAVADIATDGGTLVPLEFGEVGRLCQSLNLQEKTAGLNTEPPHRESGQERLFRVVYVTDVNAADAREAAVFTHQIMTDPESLPPMLQVMNHAGSIVTVDLSAT